MKFLTTPYFFYRGLPPSAFNLDFSRSKSRPLGEDDEREQIEKMEIQMKEERKRKIWMGINQMTGKEMKLLVIMVSRHKRLLVIDRF